jgi:hypothetical protein
MQKANSKWYATAYRRNVIDMHITDYDERFLSQFDPDQYVELLAISQAQSAVVYSHSHVGLTYFPTKVGQMHRNLHGRDIFAEVAKRCHERGIGVVAYMSLIFDAWAYNTHPDWRIIRADGRPHAEGGRYGVCCPNSPYRDYVPALVTELCEQHEFEGVRFDMTFWPGVCYCRHCQRRFAEEVGGELPRVINWEDPNWVAFQRKREQWLAEFAAIATATVKRLKPEASVEHQASTYVSGWVTGVAQPLIAQNDFLQGDFYGDALQGSFVRKLLYNISPNRPYGFETSFCVSINNHTAMKSKELLKAKASAAIADGGAFIFIDAIDPVGTLNPRVYRRMGEVFDETRRYDAFRGGTQRQDVAIYMSTESKYQPADNGKAVDDPSVQGWASGAHIDAAVSAARSLIEHHIPFGVISKRNLAQLNQHSILVLPNVLMMDAEEAEAIRAWVREGGLVYASKTTSLTTKDGRRQPNFLLSDVFGVSYSGATQPEVTYIAPSVGQGELFCDYSPQYPLCLMSPQVMVRAAADATVLGTLTLPYGFDDPVQFASIHSNPPGLATDSPAVVLHPFGKGKAVYVAGDLERSDEHRDTFVNLLRLLTSSFSFEADAPKAVEVTLFDQPERKRLLVNLINFQKDLPNIPVEGVTVRVRLDGREPVRVTVLPDGWELDYRVREGYAEFTAPLIETFAMLALDYA